MLVDKKKYELPGDPDRDAYVVGVSGGADSSAVAIIMHKLFPDLDIKYVFIDTFAEAPAIYSSIEALEKYIGKKVIKIENGVGMFGMIEQYNGHLPTARSRWCTYRLKIEPMENYLESLQEEGGGDVHMFVGLRADEPSRTGMVSSDDWMHAHYPLRELCMDRAAVFALLGETVGVPDLYKGRSRSGCEICWGMRQSEVISAIESPGMYLDDAQRAEFLSDEDVASYEIRGHDATKDQISIDGLGELPGCSYAKQHAPADDDTRVYVGVESLPGFVRIVGWSSTRSGITRKLNSHYTSRLESCEVFGLTQDEFVEQYRQRVFVIDVSNEDANFSPPAYDNFCWKQDQPIIKVKQNLSALKNIFLSDHDRIKCMDEHTPKYYKKDYGQNAVCSVCSK